MYRRLILLTLAIRVVVMVVVAVAVLEIFRLPEPKVRIMGNL
jgi:hypothetical protein